MRPAPARRGSPAALLPRDPLPLLASAVLLAAAFPPLHLVVPSFVALVPLAVWIERTGDGRDAFRGGLLFGLLAWLVLLRWLPVTLARFLPGALPGWLVVVGVLGAITAGVVWAAWRMRHALAMPLWAALPLAWGAGEWLRANLPGSLAFPWLELAVSLAGSPALLAAAELVGSRGVGLWLVTVNGLSAAAWVAWRPSAAGGSAAGGPAADRGRRAALLAVAAAVVAGAPASWGAWRAATLVSSPVLRVAVVQTAVPQDVKNDREAATAAGLDALERLLPLAAETSPEVVLLPEALLPVPLEAPEGAPARARLEAAVRAAGVPVLVGALGTAPRGPHNSLFLVRPETGLAPERYDKRTLVPVVERVPLPSALGGGDGGRWGNMVFGSAPAPLEVAGVEVGVLICLESSFARLARDARRAGADVLVNPTNDAWLNGTSPWTRLSALRQHPAHLVVRTIETRSGAARAANTGISLFVDPDGSVHQRIGPFMEGVETRTVAAAGRPTLFVRTGDVAGTAAAALTLVLVALSFLGSGRHFTKRRG